MRLVVGWSLALPVVSPAAAAVPSLQRSALIAIHDATGGTGWSRSRNWLGPPGTECAWEGVTCNSDGTQVIGLDLQSNKLTGALPRAIGDLSNLYTLHLANNALTGPIPSEIGGTDLGFFFAENNRLSGGVPATIGALEQLEILDLRNNRLSEALPPALGNLPRLRDLLLERNELPGEIPDALGNLRSLQRLNLTGNLLTGGIPRSLGSLSTLVELRLDQNALTGPIPAELGDLANLLVLDLGANPLIGAIPGDLGKLRKLTQLSLGQTDLSGPIPAALGTLSSLRILSLGGAALGGRLPALGGLTSLVELRLAANRLTGDVPDDIVGLRNLAIVDLRWNALATDNPAAKSFLDLRAPDHDFAATQTATPTGLRASPMSSFPFGLNRFLVRWTPIEYTGNNRGYRLRVVRSGLVTDTIVTASKSQSSVEISLFAEGTYSLFLEAFTTPHASNRNVVTSESAMVQLVPILPSRPGTLQFSSSGFHASEGETKFLAVTRLNGTDGRVVATLSSAFGSAHEGTDFLIDQKFLVWENGDGGAKIVRVSVFDDLEREGSEVVDLRLSVASGGATLGRPGSAFLVLDDRELPDNGDEGDISSSGSRPVVAVDPAGNRLVLWEDAGDIAGQFYDAAGVPEGKRFRVNDATPTIAERRPAVAAAGEREFEAVWEGAGRIHRRRIVKPKDSLTLGAEEVVDAGESTASSEPAVATVPATGESVVVWLNGERVLARRFTAAGAPAGGLLAVGDDAGGAPAVAVDDAGDRVAIVWPQAERVAGAGIVARLFDGAGAPVGEPVRVNVDPAGRQASPGVAAGAADDFTVVWQSEIASGAATDVEIRARRLDRDGGAGAGELKVNAGSSGAQTAPRIARGDGGDCVVAWQSEGGSGGAGIFGRTLAECARPVGGDLRLDASEESVRSPSAALAPSGQVTAVYTKDDRVEGDGGIAGRVVAPCRPDEQTLCLLGHRLRVRAYRLAPGAGGGLVPAGAAPATDRSGSFWFFDRGNLEVIVKVVDGRAVNGGLWLFHAPLSSLDYELAVEDSESGDRWVFQSPPQDFCGGVEVLATPAAGALDQAWRLPPAPPAPLPVGPAETSAAGTCVPDPTTLCLQGNRFAVRVDWRAGAAAGRGAATPVSDAAGLFWFFSDDNLELGVKVLDGTSANGHFWVFFGALTGADFTLTVIDTVRGATKTYRHPADGLCGGADTTAFTP